MQTISCHSERLLTFCFLRERVNCEDNTSLGEFNLSPIPPMRAGDAVLEVVFEVDVNGILKVTATEKTSGRSANITISNSVGKLSSGEIEKMVEDAAKFKSSDEAFSKKFESRQQLESYISRVEEIVSDPTMSMKLKRGQKEKIEGALSEAMAQLEVEDASSEDLKKKELALKRVVTKVSCRGAPARRLDADTLRRPCLPAKLFVHPPPQNPPISGMCICWRYGVSRVACYPSYDASI